MTLQWKIVEQKLTGPNRARHLDANAPSEFPVPQFGEHDLEPPSNLQVWHSPRHGHDRAGIAVESGTYYFQSKH